MVEPRYSLAFFAIDIHQPDCIVAGAGIHSFFRNVNTHEANSQC